MIGQWNKATGSRRKRITAKRGLSKILPARICPIFIILMVYAKMDNAQ